MIEIGTNGTLAPEVGRFLEGTRRAERKGYDSIWWPDHLMGWHPQSVWTPDVTGLAEFMPNPHIHLDPIAAMAASVTHTESIRVGTSVTEPVRRHPAMIAQEFLTLDHLSQGRVILGIGAGEGENIEPYGLSQARPASRFEEALTIIRLLWENDGPVDFEGDFWELRDAVVGMAPYAEDGSEARRYPPIWAGAHGPRMLSILGRLCDGWLPSYLGGPGPWSEGLHRVLASAEEAGRDRDAITPALWAVVVVDEDESEVDRLLATPLLRGWQLILPSYEYERMGHQHPMGSGYHGLTDYVPSRLDRDQAMEAFDAVPVDVVRKFTLNGTPDDILRELHEFVAAGLQHVVLWNLTYVGDLGKLRSSYHLVDEIAAQLRSDLAAGA